MSAFFIQGKEPAFNMCVGVHIGRACFLPFLFFLFLSRQSCYVAQAGLEQSSSFRLTSDGFLAWAHLHAGPSLTLLVDFLKQAAHGQHPQEYCRGL